MIDFGVITPVIEPNEWCAGVVVVSKNNKKVQICINCTHLNKSSLRKRHMLPVVNEDLTKLARAEVFSNRILSCVLANSFQQKILNILETRKGVISHMDI